MMGFVMSGDEGATFVFLSLLSLLHLLFLPLLFTKAIRQNLYIQDTPLKTERMTASRAFFNNDKTQTHALRVLFSSTVNLEQEESSMQF